MPPTVYLVALVTRGSGALGYSYSGPAGLQPGALVLVRFRGKVEVGLVVEAEPAPPPAVELEQLIPLVSAQPAWGTLLLDCCKLHCCAPHEVVASLQLVKGRTGFKLSLEPKAVAPPVAASIVRLAGALDTAKQKELAKAPSWRAAAAACWTGQAELRLQFGGTPEVSSVRAPLAKSYALPQLLAGQLGSLAAGALPGHYLQGLAEPPVLKQIRRVEAQSSAVLATPAASELAWQHLVWPADWQVSHDIPALPGADVRRSLTTWAALRQPGGLAADLATSVKRNEKVLVLAPQAWMLDRLWPSLAPLAPAVHRFSATQSAGVSALQLSRLSQPAGCVVLGTASAWRLACFAALDRVILIDPSHPQWRPEGYPHFDARLGLLAAMACHRTRLDLIEFGFSHFDFSLSVMPVVTTPHEPGTGPHDEYDANPLPLELRQPGVRRLVYFNRLGSARGIRCAECNSVVACPNCQRFSLRFSAQRRSFACGHCGRSFEDLRCPTCGLANLMAVTPGIEALRVRNSDVVVSAGEPRSPARGAETVIGTSELLETSPGFWPAEIVHVDAEERDRLGQDWLLALDEAARLAALYANPDFVRLAIVSSRLAPQLSANPTAQEIASACGKLMGLRRLSGLPPYGVLFRLRALSKSAPGLQAARSALGDLLGRDAASTYLRLGRPFRSRLGYELHGEFVNARVAWKELQRSRWLQATKDCTIHFAALRIWL